MIFSIISEYSWCRDAHNIEFSIYRQVFVYHSLFYCMAFNLSNSTLCVIGFEFKEMYFILGDICIMTKWLKKH